MPRFLVKQQLNNLTLGQLMNYGTMYGYSLSSEEAEHIVKVLSNPNVDPFNKDSFERVFKNIAQVADETTATKARNLFRDVIRSNGVQHLFTFDL